MPRFHFNVHDGNNPLDDGGYELSDLASARIEAVRLIGEIFRDSAQRVLSCEDWHLEVTDDDDLVLFRLDFCITEAPAMSSHRFT